jgi:hypothetical protein
MSHNKLDNKLRSEFRERWFRNAARDLRLVFATILLASAAVGVSASPIPFWTLSDKPLQPKITEDLPAGAMQAKATTACLECHEARIILQQRLSKGVWTKEVDKMMKWGAVVDPSDHDDLIDYLSVNFSSDQPAYEPPRTAVEKSGPQKSAGKSAK